MANALDIKVELLLTLVSRMRDMRRTSCFFLVAQFVEVVGCDLLSSFSARRLCGGANVGNEVGKVKSCFMTQPLKQWGVFGVKDGYGLWLRR